MPLTLHTIHPIQRIDYHACSQSGGSNHCWVQTQRRWTHNGHTPNHYKNFPDAVTKWFFQQQFESIHDSPSTHPQLQQKIMGFCSFSFFIHSNLLHSHPPTPYTSQIKFANHIFPIHQYPRILAISCYLLRNYFSRMTNPVPQPPFGQLNPHNHLKEKSQNSSLKGSAHHLSLFNYLILYPSNQHTWTSWS